jgi:hypothetical protein
VIELPAMPSAQRAGWHALMDLHERMPTGWTLIGGQMVHLHCAVRGRSPTRPTDDVDTAVDVRADCRALATFTGVLRDLGFEPDGASWQGHEHRWVRGPASVDVLIPRGLRPTSKARRTITGRETIETYGAQQAVDRSERVEVEVGDRQGSVRRPTLLGALVGKAAAIRIGVDAGAVRHVLDFAVLTTLIRPGDAVHTAGRRDREHLGNMLGRMVDETSWRFVDGAEEGVARLRLALEPEPDAATGPTAFRRG